ncbi:uncharacterized protein LOC108666256 [Hyalella azteca]|uniref:Uncharacterized protein LOC108666256 n=1 Tax=Hyalella azteca TaxID=294128 RepID=A0A8B7N418_HYAAZ|nr:uncharacterized protein LOC108666256 [Hyalella azteca]
MEILPRQIACLGVRQSYLHSSHHHGGLSASALMLQVCRSAQTQSCRAICNIGQPWVPPSPPCPAAPLRQPAARYSAPTALKQILPRLPVPALQSTIQKYLK